MASFAQGGFSGGFNRGGQIGLNVVAQRQRQKELEQARQDQFQTDMRNSVDTSSAAATKHFESVLDLITQAGSSGASDEQIDTLVENALQGPRMHAMMLAQVRAKTRAGAARAGRLDEADLALQSLGTPADFIAPFMARARSAGETARVLRDADVGTQEVKVGDNIETRITRGGVVDMTDAGLVATAARSPTQTIVTGTPEDFDARTPSQLGEATEVSIESLEESQQNILRLVEVGTSVSQNPRVAGVTGAINEVVGGPVGQVSPALAAGLSQMLTGTDPQRAQQLRTDFRTIVAQNLSNITGEESGRYTEQERTIAENALRTLPASANAQQILGAFGALFQTELARESRELMRQNKPQRFDLLNESGETIAFGDRQVSVEALNQLDQFLIDAGIVSTAVRDSIGRYLIATQIQGVVPITGNDQ